MNSKVRRVFLTALTIMGMSSALLGFQTDRRNKGYVELGVSAMQINQKIHFLSERNLTSTTPVVIDERNNFDHREKRNWVHLDYYDKEGAGLLLEMLRWDEKGTVNLANKRFGPYDFSGITTITYEVELYQLNWYQSFDYGDIGFGFTILRQDVKFTNATLIAREKMDVHLPNLRWRYREFLGDYFYYRFDAQGMYNVDKIHGYDGSAEVGLRYELEHIAGSQTNDYLQASFGYRRFEVRGRKKGGIIEFTHKGPFVRMELGSSF